jgi:DNA-binding transcriptional LysR family regulator
LELYHLKSFIKVAQTGNLTKAAEELHTSQPAISAHIKALEEECGCQLFSRTTKGMQLTDTGESLLEQAREIMASVGKFQQTAQTLNRGVHSKFSIGLNTDSSVLKIDQLVESSRKRHPLLEYHFFQSSSSTIFESILKGRYDAGFVFGESRSPELLGIPLASFKLVLIAPREWADRMEGRPFTEVAKLPWVLPPEDCIYRVILADELKRCGITLDVKLVSDQERAIKNFVRNGYGISILPEFEIDQLANPDEFYVWDRRMLPIPLSFVFLRSRAEEPPFRAMRELLDEIWGADTVGETPNHP